MKPYFLNLAGRTKKALDKRDKKAKKIFKNRFQEIYQDLLKEADKGNTYYNVLFRYGTDKSVYFNIRRGFDM